MGFTLLYLFLLILGFIREFDDGVFFEFTFIRFILNRGTGGDTYGWIMAGRRIRGK
jgi:hypothetical protein